MRESHRQARGLGRCGHKAVESSGLAWASTRERLCRNIRNKMRAYNYFLFRIYIFYRDIIRIKDDSIFFTISAASSVFIYFCPLSVSHEHSLKQIKGTLRRKESENHNKALPSRPSLACVKTFAKQEESVAVDTKRQSPRAMLGQAHMRDSAET